MGRSTSSIPKPFALLVIFYVFLVSDLRVTASIISKVSSSSPGSAVAVERIFSGGRDTMFLHRVSLNVDTIRILMLVRKRLHLPRTKANAALGH